MVRSAPLCVFLRAPFTEPRSVRATRLSVARECCDGEQSAAVSIRTCTPFLFCFLLLLPLLSVARAWLRPQMLSAGGHWENLCEAPCRPFHLTNYGGAVTAKNNKKCHTITAQYKYNFVLLPHTIINNPTTTKHQKKT